VRANRREPILGHLDDLPVTVNCAVISNLLQHKQLNAIQLDEELHIQSSDRSAKESWIRYWRFWMSAQEVVLLLEQLWKGCVP
jgi:hypothetical protein